MSKEEKGKEGFELHKRIEQNELARRQLLAENAKLLTKMYDSKLYREVLGDPTAEWKNYLAQNEIYYSRNETRNMIFIYKKFCEELGLDIQEFADIFSEHTSRLIDLISIVTKENIEEWVEKARLLTPRDWKTSIRGAKGLVTEEECEHKMDCYHICKTCGCKRKV